MLLSRFIPFDPNQPLLLPPDLRDALPAEHPALLIGELVDQLDVSAITAALPDERLDGAPAFDPRMLLRLWTYAYLTGVTVDGTTITANASKHEAMSYARMDAREAKLRAKVEAYLHRVDEHDERTLGPDDDGMSRGQLHTRQPSTARRQPNAFAPAAARNRSRVHTRAPGRRVSLYTLEIKS